jgi:hypothetical protein
LCSLKADDVEAKALADAHACAIGEFGGWVSAARAGEGTPARACPWVADSWLTSSGIG